MRGFWITTSTGAPSGTTRYLTSMTLKKVEKCTGSDNIYLTKCRWEEGTYQHAILFPTFEDCLVAIDKLPRNSPKNEPYEYQIIGAHE